MTATATGQSVSDAPRVQRSFSREQVRDLARDVLDDMAITDLVYHDLSYSEPLVLDLLERVLNRVPAGGRVLLVGANRYLAQVLLAQPMTVDIWELGDQQVADELQSAVRARVSPAALAAGRLPDSEPYDAIVLALVLEHVDAHPSEVLRWVKALLVEGGALVVASTNLGRLGTRTRALLGRGFLPDPRHTAPAQHGGWPALRQFRHYQPAELAAWAGEAGLDVREWSYRVGQTAYYHALPLTIPSYLVLKAKHALKRVAPGLREYVVLTMSPRVDEPERDVIPALADYRDWIPDAEGKTRLPMVSVILPTRDRADLLRKALPALFDQSYPADRYEIVVIDDGSVDETPRVIEEMARQAPCQFRTHRATGIGAAAARNLGMRLAAGVVVAHVDDDCVVTRGWIEAGVLGFERNVALVGGPIILPPETKLTFFDWFMIYPFDNGTYPTSNVFYRRDLALAEGGFDESFGRNLMGRPVWGWDCDLAWKLLRKGYEGRFRDAYAHAAVFHLAPKRWLMEGWRAGSMMPMVIRAVPELRPRVLVGGGLFYTWWGMAFKLGLLGSALALTQRRTGWLWLWIPWLRWATSMAEGDFWPPARWPKLLVKLALLFVAQTLTAAGLAYGSARARRLIL